MERIIRHVSPAWRQPGDDEPGDYELIQVSIFYEIEPINGSKNGMVDLKALLSAAVFVEADDKLTLIAPPEQVEQYMAIIEACAAQLHLTLREMEREQRWRYTPL